VNNGKWESSVLQGVKDNYKEGEKVKERNLSKTGGWMQF